MENQSVRICSVGLAIMSGMVGPEIDAVPVSHASRSSGRPLP
jgi:hypothetical protein